jgi:hypothetical protein
MGNVKKDLLAEIDRKVKKKQESKDLAAQRSTVESFVLQFIDNVEESNRVEDEVDATMLAQFALENLRSQIKSLDPKGECEVSWHREDGQKSVVNGVTIKWSGHYQVTHQCEPHLFIDATEVLFR